MRRQREEDCRSLQATTLSPHLGSDPVSKKEKVGARLSDLNIYSWVQVPAHTYVYEQYPCKSYFGILTFLLLKSNTKITKEQGKVP